MDGIGPGNRLGLRRRVENLDERLVGIGRLEHVERIASARRLGVASDENAAIHRHKVRGKEQVLPERHLHLASMAMIEEAIGRQAAVDVVEMGLGARRLARARHARHAVDGDAARLDQSRIDQRFERQDGSRRIATRCRDRPRAPDRLAVQFGDAVFEHVEQVGGLVRLAVPGRIVVRARKAEVCAQIHERHAGIEDRGRECLRHAMGEGGKDEIDLAQHGVVILDDRRPRIGHGKVRMHGAELLSRLARPAQDRGLDQRMRGQQPQQFAAGIAARAENQGPFHFHGAPICMDRS